MKKILEITKYGEGDIRFKTDLNPVNNPDLIHELIADIAHAFTTTLWGGNERSILAIIRALAVADLGVSVNREQMIRFLDETSAQVELVQKEIQKQIIAEGGMVIPPKMSSTMN